MFRLDKDYHLTEMKLEETRAEINMEKTRPIPNIQERLNKLVRLMFEEPKRLPVKIRTK